MIACVIIQAQCASNRYLGKTLAPLLGKPIILRTNELKVRAGGQDHVYVATGDELIVEVVKAALEDVAPVEADLKRLCDR